MMRNKNEIRNAFKNIFQPRNPFFIPSVFSDPEALILERTQGRTRKMEARMVSIFVHAGLLSIALLMVHQADKVVLPDKSAPVFLNNPFLLPFEGDGRGGGGGGGENEPGPAATGFMPAATRIQMLAPDPGLTPLRVAEDLLALLPSVQMPIEISREDTLPIGVVTGMPNGLTSSGPGTGGGIGDGNGPGIGEGDGHGVGPGAKGGSGGNKEGSIRGIAKVYEPGGGVKPPQLLVQPKPDYTETARKARAEGSVILQVLVRKNGIADDFKILRGLGYGLDESAIRTISSKWRFKPGTLNGMPVDVLINVEITFRLY